MKKQSKGVMIYIVLLTVVSLGIGGFYIWKTNRAATLEGGTVSSNEFYTLRNNATEYQKKEYEALTEALKASPRDDKLISELIAKNFVADFYTWTNKLRFNDVGGMQYISKELQPWVYSQAIDTFYNDMRYYKEQGSLEKTLEIVDASTTVKPDKLKILTNIGKEDEASSEIDGYRVEITWKYQEGSKISTSDYQTNASIFVTKDKDGLYSIMEVDNGQENSRASRTNTNEN